MNTYQIKIIIISKRLTLNFNFMNDVNKNLLNSWKEFIIELNKQIISTLNSWISFSKEELLLWIEWKILDFDWLWISLLTILYSRMNWILNESSEENSIYNIIWFIQNNHDIIKEINEISNEISESFVFIKLKIKENLIKLEKQEKEKDIEKQEKFISNILLYSFLWEEIKKESK